MAHAATLALLAAVCIIAAVVSPAAAQTNGVLPDRTAGNSTFNGTASEYKFAFNVPTNGSNKLETNGLAALRLSGVSSRNFALGACELFIPHFHPGAAEYFIGVEGRIELVALIGNELVRNTINKDDSVIVPRNTFHYFSNSECETSAVISSLPSATAGFAGYYNLPAAITDLRADFDDIEDLLANTPSNGTLEGSRAFIPLTTDCARQCKKRNGKLGHGNNKVGVKVGKNGIKINIFGR